MGYTENEAEEEQDIMAEGIGEYGQTTSKAQLNLFGEVVDNQNSDDEEVS